MKEASYNNKGTLNISLLSDIQIILVSPNSIAELGDFFYLIITTNSSNIKQNIIILWKKINKSFLFILPPPITRLEISPKLLNVPI